MGSPSLLQQRRQNGSWRPSGVMVRANVRVERPAATAARHERTAPIGGSARTPGWAACVYVLCKMMRSVMPRVWLRETPRSCGKPSVILYHAPLSLRIRGTRVLPLGHHPASPWPVHSYLAQGPRSSQSVSRMSGRTSLSCPRTSGNWSTSPRLEQNERTTLEPKALPGTLSRETYDTLSNDSTELLRRGPTISYRIPPHKHPPLSMAPSQCSTPSCRPTFELSGRNRHGA